MVVVIKNEHFVILLEFCIFLKSSHFPCYIHVIISTIKAFSSLSTLFAFYFLEAYTSDKTAKFSTTTKQTPRKLWYAKFKFCLHSYK